MRIFVVVFLSIVVLVCASSDYATENIVFQQHEETQKETFETSVIKELRPEVVWRHFYDLTQIPRPSTFTHLVQQYLVNYAKVHGFDYSTDDAGNTVIRVGASPGYEQVPSIAIQAHSDIVPDKVDGKVFDFKKDPIQLKLSSDGLWLQANGTTLGADDGIGVALALAIGASAKDMKHGPIELLVTTDEEIGLVSAVKLSPDFIQSRLLLNVDTVERDKFTIGSASGVSTRGTLTLKVEEPNSEYTAFKLRVSGLIGGQSGIEIIHPRANALKLLARTLSFFSDKQVKYQLGHIEGGNAGNAIPREATAKLLIEKGHPLEDLVAEFAQTVKDEYKLADPNLQIELIPVEEKLTSVFKPCCLKKILRTLHALPHGVQSMSLDIKGAVETSTNLATVRTEGEKVQILCTHRSFVPSSLSAIQQRVKAILELAGAEIDSFGAYPGQRPNKTSPLLHRACQVFRSMYGKEVTLDIVHAGLETGVLSQLYEGIQMVAYGATITGFHTPEEQVKIEDVQYLYDLTRQIIESIAAQPLSE